MDKDRFVTQHFPIVKELIITNCNRAGYEVEVCPEYRNHKNLLRLLKFKSVDAEALAMFFDSILLSFRIRGAA